MATKSKIGERRNSLKGDNAAAQSSADLVKKMLAAPNGASIDQLAIATGWQKHSVRARISTFRKAGRNIVRTRAGKISRYRELIDKTPGAAQ